MPSTKGGRGRSRFVSWFGLGGIVLIAGALSLQAYREGLPSAMESVPHLDKFFHFTIGGTMAFFLDILLRRRMVRIAALRVAIPLTALLLLIPAGIEEYLQRYSIYRSSSIWDFAADTAGVVFFIWLSRRLVRPDQNQNQNQNQNPD
jgi:VanZ family protein